MSTDSDVDDRVVLVTGASGALGSGICERFQEEGATVCATDLVPPEDDDSLLDAEGVDFYEADFTDESDVERVVGKVVDDHARLDALCNIAGTWRGGQPIEETPVDEFEMLFDVNLKTAFLASKHALSQLQKSEGSIVSISSRSSLEGGEGDGPYRASKAGIRRLTETIAEENKGVVRANAVMPSVIDTPMNRDMMPDSDHEKWVDPVDIATVIAFLCSEGASPTSGAAVPVYGET